MNTQTRTATRFVIHPATRLGHVNLTVANLDRQIAFHRDILGFKLHWREGAEAGLGAGGEDLFRFTEVPGARRVRGTTGLYHTAILVPTKWELAQLLQRIAETRTPLQGMSNHGTHLAIYLPDAEGNGLELAWDFPRDQWPSFDTMLLSAGPRPLDVDDLVAELRRDPSPWTGMHPDTKVGHVHLHVAAINSAGKFYHDVLGFDTVFQSPEYGVHFVSAGGYHHHIGLNTWQGVGAPLPPPDATGLRYFTVVLPDKTELKQVLEQIQAAGIATEETNEGILVHDPSRNGVLLTAS